MNPSKTRILGTFVDCPKLGDIRILHDHVLDLDENGFIDAFGPKKLDPGQSYDRKVIIIPDGTFFLPSFCDLHLHAPQYLYQGTGLHLPLMQWLNQYAFKAEERIDADPDLAKRVYTRLAERLVENGTGAVLLFGTINEDTNLILASTMQAAGIRAFVGKLSMDQSSRPSYVEPSADAALRAAESFSARCSALVAHLPAHARLVEPVLTPRFVPTCSDALLSGLGALAAAQGLRVQSHLAEARDQVEWVRAERGREDIDVFDSHALLTPRTIQAHCTYLTHPTSPAGPAPTAQRDDFARLAERGTAIAHCPLSNAYFSARPFALREALAAGVRVGLGTDVAGGYSVDVMNAMRAAVVVARMREGQFRESGAGLDDGGGAGVDWKVAMYLATRGGALALGLPRGAGSFTVGAPFDAQLIRAYDGASSVPAVGALDFFDPPHGITEEVVEKWWCVGDCRNRVGVWIQGRELPRAPVLVMA